MCIVGIPKRPTTQFNISPPLLNRFESMAYLRLLPALFLTLFFTGCGSDEIEVSEEQSAAQKKVEELGGLWTGRGAISVDFSAPRMASQSKTITDAELAVLAEVENLEMLDLSGSSISDAGIAHIAGLTKVNTINLTGTQITGAGIQAIAGLPLFQITLKDCTDEIAIEIANISTVKILQIDSPQLTNVGIAALAELKQLRQLTISGSQLTNEGLATLSDSVSLNSLDLSNTQVTDEGLAVLGGLSALNSVGLTGTAVTQNGVDKLQQLLPDTFIDFQDADPNIGDPDLGGIEGEMEGGSERSFSDNTGVAHYKKESPLDAITNFFKGKDEPGLEEAPADDGEPAEPEQKEGGTLGAIFRSLNPLPN